MKAGTFETLRIDEKVEYGYYLSNGEERVLLHKTQITDEINIGEELDVFLLLDSEDRLSATMKKPKITEDTYEWVEVVDVLERSGVFIDIGLNKDALVADDHLPFLREVWPQAGDMLYCTLKVTNNGKLFARLGTEEVFESKFEAADRELFNKEVSGVVYRMIIAGSYIITDEGYKGFIHSSQRTREPRLGERVTGRVIDVKEDGTLNVSLLPRKHEAIGEDAVKILAYMEDRGGAMPYWDKSDPDDIKETFDMSKGAFKRAVGNLMKYGTVYQEEGWTFKVRDQSDSKEESSAE